MKEIKIEWLGHSCFRVEKDGYVIVFDPYEDRNVPGLTMQTLEADEVFVSHEHGDHNAREKVILRSTGNANPFKVARMEGYHDECNGEKRGSNTITILESEELSLAHLGDIGCFPEDEQMRQLSGLDVILVPVGGFYTMEPEKIRMLLEKLEPKVIVPMHYRGRNFGYDVIGTVDTFLREKDPIVRYNSSEMIITPETERQIALLTCPCQER